AGYGAFELYSGIAGSSDGIAHFAHLGGLITGFILIKLWQRFDPTFRLL
ncbi:MAG: membrane associated rhomboid family serine protease, partial [Salibacteraceae bacterium]